MSDRRILVIDEDAEARRTLRAALSGLGWQVESCPDCFSALEQISRERKAGGGYGCIAGDLFQPDMDGKLFYATLRSQYPQLPLVIVTGYGNEVSRQRVAQLAPAHYLERPLDAAALRAVLDSLEPGGDTTTPLAPPQALPEPGLLQFIFVKFDSMAMAGRHLAQIRALPGVVSADALKGEGVDLVLQAAVAGEQEYATLQDALGELEGVCVVRSERTDPAALPAELQDFARHYRAISSAGPEGQAGAGTNAYLLIDIAADQLERIYLSVLLTEGVLSCRVIEGRARLIVLASGVVRPNIVRHLLQKLAQLDGIRRVREITVVDMGA